VHCCLCLPVYKNTTIAAVSISMSLAIRSQPTLPAPERVKQPHSMFSPLAIAERAEMMKIVTRTDAIALAASIQIPITRPRPVRISIYGRTMASILTINTGRSLYAAMSPAKRAGSAILPTAAYMNIAPRESLSINNGSLPQRLFTGLYRVSGLLPGGDTIQHY